MSRYVLYIYAGYGHYTEMDPTDSLPRARKDLATMYGGKGFVFDRWTKTEA